MCTEKCRCVFAPLGGVAVEERRKCVYLFRGTSTALDAARSLREAVGEDAPVTIALAEIGQYTTGRWISKLSEVSSKAVPGSLLGVGEIVEKLTKVIDPGETQELGRHSFSDLSPPERVIAFDVHFMYPEKPGLKGLDLYDHTLPTLFDSFVGRESLMDRIELSIRASRLVTLTGCGGAGKTRLATQAAARILGEGVEICRIVYLAPVTGVDSVGQALADQCGVTGGGVDAVVDEFRSKSCLFVVDNCEHVLAGARSAILDILSHVPRSQVIATSREALSVGGEIVIEVPPLPEARSLFIERVQERRAIYDPDLAELDLIDEICSRVAGLPLAIEHAAGHSSVIGVSECLARLKIGLKDLRMDGEDRHLTMEATIRWSYDLLDQDERESAEILAGFSSSFQLVDAEEVLFRESAYIVLTALVRKSLVVRSFDKEGQPWFHMLAPVREYSISRPSEIRSQRMRDYVERLINEAYAYSEGEKTDRDFRFLAKRYATVRTILQEIVSTGDPAGKSLCTKMTRFWTEYGHVFDGIRLITECLLDQSGEYSPEADNALAVMLWVNGDFDEAEGQFRLLLEEARKRNDNLWVASVLSNLGSLKNQKGEYEEARQYLVEAFNLLLVEGDVPRWAKSAGNLANLLLQIGEYGEAVSVLERTLSTDGGLIPVETIHMLRLNLCDALRLTSNVAECVGILDLLIASGMDNPATAAPTVLRLSLVLCLTERYEQAARTLGVAKVLYEEIEGAGFAPRQGMVDEIEDSLRDALSEDRWRELELVGKLLSPEDVLPAVMDLLRDIS